MGLVPNEIYPVGPLKPVSTNKNETPQNEENKIVYTHIGAGICFVGESKYIKDRVRTILN